MVFFDWSCFSETVRQPVAIIFDEITGVLGEFVVKTGLLGHNGVRIWSGAVRDRPLKCFFAAVGPYVNVCRVPPVCRTGVIRAGRTNANDIGQCA